MKNNTIVVYLYVFLILLYFLQGTLYSEGGVISRFCIALFVAISLYYQVVVSFKYRHPLLWITNLFICVMTIYGIWAVLNQSLNSMFALNNLKILYASLSPVFPIYYFTRNGVWDENKMKISAILFIIIGTVQFYYTQRMEIIDALESGIIREEITNNTGYMFVGLIPVLTLFSRRKWLFWSLLLYLSYYVLISAKRGAIGVAILLIAILLYHEIRRGRGFHRVMNWVTVTAVTVFGLYYAVDKIFANSEYLQSRYEATLEGSSSGRDVIYSKLWNYWTDAQLPVGKFFFGSGFYDSISIAGNFAHQDWLELAVDLGLLGVIIYFIYYLVFFRTVRQARNGQNEMIYVSLLMLFVMMLSRSFFSMSFSNVNNVFPSMYLGLLLAWLPSRPDRRLNV